VYDQAIELAGNTVETAYLTRRVRGSISLTGQFAAVDEILSGRENLVLVAQLRHAQPGHQHHDHDHADRLHAAVRLRVRRRDRVRIGFLCGLSAARHPKPTAISNRMPGA
jgi:ABC-type multidrug transport system ATPase subunit